MAKASKIIRTSSNKKNISPSIIVGGVFLLMAGLIAVMLINIKVNTLENSIQKKRNDNVSSKGDFDKDYIDKKVKLFLFDHEIEKSRIIKHSTSNSEGKEVINYTISVHQNEKESLMKAFSNFFKVNGFSAIKSESADIIYQNSRSVVSIDFQSNLEESTVKEIYNTEEKEIKKSKPQKNESIVDEEKGKMAIIIDDAGQNLELANRLVDIGYFTTMSVLPFTKYDKETVKLARHKKMEVFLHLPMEPKSYPDTDPGKGALLLSNPKPLMAVTIKQNIERIGKVDGINNHMGSAFTESSQKMDEALDIIAEYSNIFVDSHTSGNTVAFELCKTKKLKCGINRKFLDNSDDPEYIKKKLLDGADIAVNEGKVIVIGHLRTSTVETLAKVLPEIEKRGIKIVKVREVLN